MPREIAYELLRAEVAAWPFASRAAFDACTLRLGQVHAGILDPATQSLADALEGHLRLRAAGLSLNALARMRDERWFGGDQTPLALADFLSRLAHEMLESRGASVGLRSTLHDDGALCERAVAWRWLSLLLPQDLLVAALFAVQQRSPTRDCVTLGGEQLRGVLEQQVANTHLHVNAGRSFTELWGTVMHALAENEIKATNFSGDRALPFGPPPLYLRLLLCAAITRLILASFLQHRRALPAPGGNRLDVFWQRQGPTSCLQLGWPGGPAEPHALVLDALRMSTRDPTGADHGCLRVLYRKLVGPIRNAARADPLASWYPAGGARVSAETCLAADAIDYLTGVGSKDDSFAAAFWQYTRLRCLTFRYLTLEPYTAGLDWFRLHDERRNRFRSKRDPRALAHALALEAPDLGLQSLEARTVPGATYAHTKQLLRGFAKDALRYAQDSPRLPMETGQVLHFTKEHLCKACGRLQLDPRHRAFAARCGPWFDQRVRQARGIATVLRRHPEVLLVLRGIDIASRELALPTWVFTPLFRIVDSAAEEAAVRLAHTRPTWNVTPLRHTVHAGEDFRRLMEGLRRMHETMEFGLLRAGDRIGHGFALGVDPARWAASGRSVAQPCEERLDDLLWEMDRYGRGDWTPDTGRLEYVRTECTRLARRVYDRTLSLEELVAARRHRHDPKVLEDLEYPVRRGTRTPPPVAAHPLLWTYLTDGATFDRGQVSESVDVTAAEVAVLGHAQHWLAREIARHEITIETNPSSNLLVGDMLDISEHPLFRFQPLPDCAPPEWQYVLASVNDDDPLTFATRLADEYAYLYCAMLRSGVSAHTALPYIERLRDTGWRSRFTLPASADPDALRVVTGPPPWAGIRSR